MEKYIPPSTYDVVDFTIHDTAHTDSLDACIASITYSETEGMGSMSHLFYDHNFKKYVTWLRSHINPQNALVYLVGGISHSRINARFTDESEQKPRILSSQSGIRVLERLLAASDFRIVARDVLGRKTRNVTLTKDGRVLVKWRDYGNGAQWQSGVLRPGCTKPLPLKTQTIINEAWHKKRA